MCSVVGYVPIDPGPGAAEAFARLYREGSIRGHHAYGIALLDRVEKPWPHELRVYRYFEMEDAIKEFSPSQPAIAHTRYSTSGDWHNVENNQPIVVGDVALAFNGVIHMGTKAEFEQDFDVQCDSDNDGEIFLQKIGHIEDHVAMAHEADKFIQGIRGSFAGVWLAGGRLFAGRNARRPLWRCLAHGAVWYASTEDIFRRAGFEGMTLMGEHVESVGQA